MTRRICVLTGTRAEYGLLYWVIRRIAEDPELELQLLVTGMHLSPEFGFTVREIERDGFAIAAKVEMLLSSDTPVGTAKSMGLGTIGFADAFDRLQPDLLVVLGDRFEVLAAVQAAMVSRVPIAHLHGGELTEGAIDEAIRHAITKMAHLHFTAAEPYRRRVIQMGEQPDRVFNVGTPGLDHLAALDWMSRDALSADLAFEIRDPFFLVTYHPVTLEGDPTASMRELLAALDAFPDASVLMTYPNADAGGRVLIEMIDAYSARHPGRVKAATSLGQRRYLSAMREADVVIGNSSSGLTEAPALRRPTVNLGDRQRGRLKAASVIDCGETAGEVTAAIRYALSDAFLRSLASVESPYAAGGASARIVDEIKRWSPDALLKKQFYDQ